MLLHPLATPFPEATPHREKHFDIIFTGSALAPFHSESRASCSTWRSSEANTP